MSNATNSGEDRWWEGLEENEHGELVAPPPSQVNDVEPSGLTPTVPTACSGEALRGLGERGRPSAKLSTPFLKGPVDWEWVARAAKLRKSALAIGLGLWREVGLKQDGFLKEKRPASDLIEVRSKIRKQLRMSTSQMSRGIHALAADGLIDIVVGGAGRIPVVAIRNLHALNGTEGGGA